MIKKKYVHIFPRAIIKDITLYNLIIPSNMHKSYSQIYTFYQNFYLCMYLFIKSISVVTLSAISRHLHPKQFTVKLLYTVSNDG